MHKIRFMTQLRGKEAEVELEIQSLFPIAFTTEFFSGEPASPPTQAEVEALIAGAIACAKCAHARLEVRGTRELCLDCQRVRIRETQRI